MERFKYSICTNNSTGKHRETERGAEADIQKETETWTQADTQADKDRKRKKTQTHTSTATIRKNKNKHRQRYKETERLHSQKTQTQTKNTLRSAEQKGTKSGTGISGFFLPVQFTPSLLKPLLQVQLNEPGVLWH